MNHQLLQFLHSLKDLLAVPSMATTDQGVKAHLGAIDQLVGQMIVHETVLPELRAEAQAAYRALVPQLEAAVAGDDAAADLLKELAETCASSDAKAFQETSRLAGEIQQALFKKQTAAANDLCARIVAISAKYSVKYTEALRQRALPAESETPASTAKNAKEFDKDLLTRFIANTLPTEAGVSIADSKFISGGYSKYTVALTLAGNKSLPENLVLRGDAGAMFGGVSVINEYRLLDVLHKHGACVPKPLAVEQTGQVFGAPFMLMERSGGGVIGHMFMLPPANPALCRDIAAKLAQIHSVPLAALGDGIEGAHTKTSVKVKGWLDEAYANWKPLNMPSPVFEAAFQWLRANVVITDEVPRGLVHADFGLNNLLIDGDKVSAVLDWEFAHVGNPAYDLGYFYFMAQSLASWDEFLAAYAAAGGSIPDSRQLDYQILLAATRLGTMLCQVIASYHAGGNRGLSVAMPVAGAWDEVAIQRIAGVLERVL